MWNVENASRFLTAFSEILSFSRATRYRLAQQMNERNMGTISNRALEIANGVHKHIMAASFPSVH